MSVKWCVSKYKWLLKYWEPSTNPAPYRLALKILVLPPSPHYQVALLGQLQCLTSCKSCVAVEVTACQVVTEERPERQQMSAALMWSLSDIAAEGKEMSSDPG